MVIYIKVILKQMRTSLLKTSPGYLNRVKGEKVRQPPPRTRQLISHHIHLVLYDPPCVALWSMTPSAVNPRALILTVHLSETNENGTFKSIAMTFEPDDKHDNLYVINV